MTFLETVVFVALAGMVSACAIAFERRDVPAFSRLYAAFATGGSALVFALGAIRLATGS